MSAEIMGANLNIFYSIFEEKKILFDFYHATMTVGLWDSGDLIGTADTPL